MISKRYNRLIQVQIKRLGRHARRVWYTPLLSLLAFLDNFFIFIPNDGILVSSSILVNRKWHWFALSMAIGSSLGALLLAYLVAQNGWSMILNYFPDIEQSMIWGWSEIFLEKHGLLFVFIIGLSPIMQHPAIILAALANTSLAHLGVAIFLGRALKYLFLAYLASHAPKYINRLWRIKEGEKYV